MTENSTSAGPETSGAGKGRLAGRVALVTGASRGIGFAVARRFAAVLSRFLLLRADSRLRRRRLEGDAIQSVRRLNVTVCRPGAGGPALHTVRLNTGKTLARNFALGRESYTFFGGPQTVKNPLALRFWGLNP